jgi:methylated-DNA-[protein]-cysteine S-methyltransferase
MGSSDMKEQFFYQRLNSIFGEIGLVWTPGEGNHCPLVIRIFLPAEGGDMKAMIQEAFPGAVNHTNDTIAQIIHQIGRCLEGDAVEFSLNHLNLAACGAFQQQVLRLEFQIPRGKVSTYGRLAGRLGHPRAARAVGTALARNPFPIIVPCHRTIRSDGMLGGFGGGLKMKRALLEMEGVQFDRYGRVVKESFEL